MININSLLNGEKLEYSKNWDYKDDTYQLCITAKHLYWCRIYNKEKPYYQINTFNLDFCIGTHLGTAGITTDSVTKTVSADKFELYLREKNDKSFCSFQFPGTAEGLRTAEEVYQVIVRVINGLK